MTLKKPKKPDNNVTKLSDGVQAAAEMAVNTLKQTGGAIPVPFLKETAAGFLVLLVNYREMKEVSGDLQELVEDVAAFMQIVLDFDTEERENMTSKLQDAVKSLQSDMDRIKTRCMKMQSRGGFLKYLYVVIDKGKVAALQRNFQNTKGRFNTSLEIDIWKESRKPHPPTLTSEELLAVVNQALNRFYKGGSAPPPNTPAESETPASSLANSFTSAQHSQPLGKPQPSTSHRPPSPQYDARPNPEYPAQHPPFDDGRHSPGGHFQPAAPHPPQPPPPGSTGYPPNPYGSMRYSQHPSEYESRYGRSEDPSYGISNGHGSSNGMNFSMGSSQNTFNGQFNPSFSDNRSDNRTFNTHHGRKFNNYGNYFPGNIKNLNFGTTMNGGTFNQY